MSESMVERVARAIDSELWNRIAKTSPLIDFKGKTVGQRLLEGPVLNDPDIIKSITRAKTAIKAMRDAGLDHKWSGDIFRAMIDRALK